MIKRYESCIGISFPAFRRCKIEVWYAPRGYEIKEHTHPNQDIKLRLLFGHNVRFHRRKRGHVCGESFWATFRNIGKVFTINAGDSHHFEVSNWPLIFLNVEKWKEGVEITSAAEDFQLTSSS